MFSSGIREAVKSNANVDISPVSKVLTAVYTGWASDQFICSQYRTVGIDIECDLQSSDSMELQILKINSEGVPDRQSTIVGGADAAGISEVLPHSLTFKKTAWTQTFKAQVLVLVPETHKVLVRAKATGSLEIDPTLTVKALGGKGM